MSRQKIFNGFHRNIYVCTRKPYFLLAEKSNNFFNQTPPLYIGKKILTVDLTEQTNLLELPRLFVCVGLYVLHWIAFLCKRLLHKREAPVLAMKTIRIHQGVRKTFSKVSCCECLRTYILEEESTTTLSIIYQCSSILSTTLLSNVVRSTSTYYVYVIFLTFAQKLKNKGKTKNSRNFRQLT